MAYTADNHDHFSRRMQNLVMRLQSVREEAAKLVDIYQNETGSGADPEWVDTPIATAAEHVDGILLCQSLEAFVDNGAVAQVDRTLWMTPFLQVAP